MSTDADSDRAIESVASAIASKDRNRHDMASVVDQFYANKETFLRKLRQAVEQWSGGRLTLRTGASSLFRRHAGTTAAYLVVCPIGTRERHITELTSVMYLVMIAPTADGLVIDAPRA